MPHFRMYPLRAANVLELYAQKSAINLEPSYQRMSVWTMPKKQLFIDSVVNGIDIPKLYFHELREPQRGQLYRYSVIDGKQRLQALWEFMNDEFPLADSFIYYDNEDIKVGGYTYSQLLASRPTVRARFDGFDVPVILVQADDEDLIEELFSRLNVQVPLSAAEGRNAMGGPLSLAIRKVSFVPLFKTQVSIRNDRYEHLDLAAKFLYLTRATGFQTTKKVVLDSFVKKLKEGRRIGSEFASKEAIEELVANTTSVLAPMQQFFQKNRDPLLTSQGRLILYFHVFRLYIALQEEVGFSRDQLAMFNRDVHAARQKSQRRASGANEVLTDQENDLVAFDREKQSYTQQAPLERQYAAFQRYFQNNFNAELPPAD